MSRQTAAKPTSNAPNMLGALNVPFVDLKADQRAILPDALAAMQRVITDTDFILGKDVDAFESEFAAFCGVRHAVGLDTGITALEFALRSMGIGAGDEVLTVSHTFIATASAVSFTGATPTFVDIDPHTFNMDPAKLERAITRRTRAILPVHLYGQPVEMDEILAIARKKGLPVVEDACQAHGARYKGRRAGALGVAAAFSFYPAKNLGCFGDGGILVTDDEEIASSARMLRNYGQREKYHHVRLAYNRRLDTVQAAALRVKLPHLDAANAARRRAAALYDQLLADVPDVTRPVASPDRTHIYHLYVIRHERRDELSAFLKTHGISCGLHYPIPVHLQECYASLGIPRGSLPVTESAAQQILSLPIYPSITEEQVRHVAAGIAAFARG